MIEIVGEAMRCSGSVKLRVKFSGTTLWGYVKGSEVERSFEVQLVEDDTTGRLRPVLEDLTAKFVDAGRYAPSASAAM